MTARQVLHRLVAVLATLGTVLALALGARVYWFSGESRRVDPPKEESATITFELLDCGLDLPVVSGSPERLLIVESLGTGAALLDFDGDRRLDILVQNGGTVERHEGSLKFVQGPGPRLYHQQTSGEFVEVTHDAGLRPCGWGTGVAVADVDNDGDPDVFLGALGSNCLWINDGNGHFRNESRSAGLDHAGFATSAVFLDYDRDGWLDLYVVNYVEFDFDDVPNNGRPCFEFDVPVSCAPSMHEPAADLLYHNQGDGTFRNVTAESGCAATTGSYGLGVATADFDRDGWPDVYVTNDTTANFLWRNRGDNTFEDIALSHGAALSEHAQGQSGMGVTLGDTNGDGWTDIFVTNYAREPNAYYESLGSGTFKERSTDAGLGIASHRYLGWGTGFFDIDHDQRLDLVVLNGHVHPRAADLGTRQSFQQPGQVFRGLGEGHFMSVENPGSDLQLPRNYRGLAVGDVDRDGAEDLLITDLDGPPLLYLNRSRGRGNWIVFRVRGRTFNRDGIGCRIEITSAETTQRREISSAAGYLCAVEPRAHFGLGAALTVERVRVRWPNGEWADLGAAQANSHYLIDEDRGLLVD